MAVWLVTGGSGFLGRHLLAELARERPGDEVVALGRRCPAGWPVERFAAADLDDPAGLARGVAAVGPDLVVHAAGRTPPADAEMLDRANRLATLHLIGALRGLGRPVRLVTLGSAAELGPVAKCELPAGEDLPCRPVDAYGRSKLAATEAALAAGPGVESMVARVFNPVGPGLPPTQAFGRFAAELAAPGPDPARLRVGDLDARRDFVDARDVARAAIGLALGGRAARVYHVGTGVSRRVGDGLAALVALSGRAVIVEPDPALGIGRGPRDSRADIGRIALEIGWRPTIPFGRSLADLWAEAAGGQALRLTALGTPV